MMLSLVKGAFRDFRDQKNPSSREAGGGGIAAQGCPLRYRALSGGIAAILSQIRVLWPTKVGSGNS